MRVKFMKDFQGWEVERYYLTDEEVDMPEGTALNLLERGIVKLIIVEPEPEPKPEPKPEPVIIKPKARHK